MMYRRTIRLLGAYPATLKWLDDSESGEILLDREFVETAPQNVHQRARAQASRLAPHVSHWLFVPHGIATDRPYKAS